MRVFLDTEFTNFTSPRLLSLGLVAVVGHDQAAGCVEPCELYVEIDLASEEGRRRKRASSDFVRSSVLNQWGRVAGAQASEFELGRRPGTWLQALAERTPGRVEIVYDDKVDANLLEAALDLSGLLPELRSKLDWSIVSYLHGEVVVEAAQAASWVRSQEFDGLERHHALADARALRMGFEAMHGD